MYLWGNCHWETPIQVLKDQALRTYYRCPKLIWKGLVTEPSVPIHQPFWMSCWLCVKLQYTSENIFISKGINLTTWTTKICQLTTGYSLSSTFEHYRWKGGYIKYQWLSILIITFEINSRMFIKLTKGWRCWDYNPYRESLPSNIFLHIKSQLVTIIIAFLLISRISR